MGLILSVSTTIQTNLFIIIPHRGISCKAGRKITLITDLLYKPKRSQCCPKKEILASYILGVRTTGNKCGNVASVLVQNMIRLSTSHQGRIYADLSIEVQLLQSHGG
jgi:hypothetical protein